MVLLGGGSGYLFATRVLFPLPEGPDELVEVPELGGRTLAEVREILEERRLAVGVVDSLRHPSLPAGTVLGQSPLVGQKALPGSEVRITVSQGADRRPLPEVLGLQADRARSLLEATGFAVEVDSVEAEEPRGSVIAQDPEGGTPVLVAGAVRLRVSLGPPMVEIPDLMGLPEEQAVETIRSLGLVVSDVRTVFRFGRDRGIVVEQDPAPGTQVDRGTALVLVVGRR
jgi:eukaryotic-like serine/threonine-protein kinase